MNKRLYFFLMFIAAVIVLGACSPEHNAASTQPISSGDMMYFSCEEDFIQYMQSSKKNDISQTDEIQKYYLLKNIPEGYELYRIASGGSDIGFWYLPSSRLSSAESISEAGAAQEEYLLISPRTKYNFSKVLLQLHLSEDNLVADGYYLKESPSPMLVWEHDGLVMMLYLPKNASVNAETVEKLCELTEKRLPH